MNAPVQLEITRENITECRKIIRDRLLTDKLLGLIEANDLVIRLEFSGSSDSGSWDYTHENEYVQSMFDVLLYSFVTWDWENNDGGGGSITWDVVSNEITIEGYYNVAERVSQPDTIISADGEFKDDEPEEESL